MNVHFNTTQQAAPPSPTAPLATIRQAAKGDDNTDSISSTSSTGKGFIATILTPFKAVASFIASIFSKIFCCCGGDSKEVKALKALKEQKAALETFQNAMQAHLDGAEGADYNAAVAALPQDVKDAIIADLKAACDAKWENGQEINHQGFAWGMLNWLGNLTDPLAPDAPHGTRPEVAMDAAEAVKAAAINVLAGIDTQLTK